VYIPNDGDIQDVGGNPTFYSVYNNIQSGGSGEIGSFTIDQVHDLGRWVSAGSFPVSGHTIAVQLHTRGQDWVGDQRTNAHHAAAQVTMTCS
jgi:hypothetical protein